MASPRKELVFFFSSLTIFAIFCKISNFRNNRKNGESCSCDSSCYFQRLRFLRKIAIFAAACKPGHKCSIDVIQIVPTVVLHLNIEGPTAIIWIPAEAHL